jgi:hypothetical protein
MKPRHATALAVIGWYLLMPPLVDNPNSTVKVETSGPLSTWDRFGKELPTKEACKAYIAHVKQLFEKSEESEKDALDYWLSHARCVSGDDPRLKEK